MAESQILKSKRQLALARQESQILLDRINLALQAPKGVRLSAPSASDTYILGTARARALVDEYMGLSASKIFNIYQGHSVQDAVSDFAMRLTAQMGGGSDVRKLVDAASEIFAVLLVRPLRDAPSREARKPAFQQGIRAGLMLFEKLLVETSSIMVALKTLNDTTDIKFTGAKGELSAEDKEELKRLYPAAGVITTSIKNPYAGEVNNYALYSNQYLRYVDSLVSKESKQRNNMLTFLSNPEVIQNVNILLGSKRPSSKVLLPKEISAAVAGKTGADAVNAVRDAFLQNPDKSIKATFDYYKALYSRVEDTDRILIDKGNFKVALKSAGQSIDALIKEIRKSPTRGDAGFISLLKKVKSSVLKAKTPNDLLDASMEYLNLIGVVPEAGIGRASVDVAGTALADALNKRYPNATVFSSLIDGLEGRKGADAKGTAEEVRYESLGNVLGGGADYWTRSMKEAAADVTYRLNYAYSSIAGLGPVTTLSRPSDKPAVTTDFKKAADERLASFVNVVGSTFATNMPVGKDGATAGLLGRVILDALAIDYSPSEAPFATYRPRAITGKIEGSNADAPVYLYMSTGNLPKANTNYAKDKALASIDENRNNLSSTERSIATSLIDATLTDLRDTVKSAIVEAQARGIAIRSNPAISYGRAAGMAAFKGIGTHAATAVTQSVVSPKLNTTGFQLAEYGASTAAIGYGAYQIYRNGDYQNGAEWIGGAILNIGLRTAARNTKLRFGEGVVAKAVQLLGNAPATLVKDPSLYGSMLTMGPVKLTADMQPFLVKLAYANSADNFVCICLKLMADSKKGIDFTGALDGSGLVSVVGRAPSSADELNNSIKSMLRFYSRLQNDAEVEATPSGIKVTGGGVGITQLTDRETLSLVASSTAAALNISGFTLPASFNLGGYIATPSYDGPPVYSATERYTPLTPQPIVHSDESGYEMLVQAIQRAHKLQAHELDVEQLSGTTSPVIKAEPSAARKMERLGLGQSLGHSMTEPHLELVAVEWTQGPVTPAPERNYAVPQGAFDPTPITQAPNIQVSPEGLFTKGAFTPLYGT